MWKLGSCRPSPQVNTIANVVDGTFHHVVVGVDGANVDVSVDGTPVLTFTIPEYTAYDGWIGITASTGTRQAEHAVRNVAVSLPDLPPCP